MDAHPLTRLQLPGADVTWSDAEVVGVSRARRDWLGSVLREGRRPLLVTTPASRLTYGPAMRRSVPTLKLNGIPDVPVLRATWSTRIDNASVLVDAVVKSVESLADLHPLTAGPYRLGPDSAEWTPARIVSALRDGVQDDDRFEGVADLSFVAPKGGWGTTPIPWLDIHLLNFSMRPKPRVNRVLFTWDRIGGSPEQRVAAMEEVGLGVLDLLIRTWRPDTAAIYSTQAERIQRMERRAQDATIGPVTWFSDNFTIPNAVAGATVAPHLGGTLVVIGDGLPDVAADPESILAVYDQLADAGALRGRTPS